MENRRGIGTAYEERAARYLSSKGYRILERSFRCRIGEIDLIGEEGGVLVFVEVKYRRSSQCGMPSEAVTPSKQRTICRVADFYRMLKGIPESKCCRFDVVAILGDQVRLYRNAFSYR